MQLSKILKLGLPFLVGAILMMSTDVFAQTIRAVGSFLQPGDVTSSHVLNGTLVNADISASAGIDATKIKGGTPAGTILFSTGSAVGTSTSLSWYTATGTMRVAGNADITGTTTLRGVDYIWPASQGAASTYLQTDGTKTLSWVGISSPQDAIGYFGQSTTSPANLDGTNTYFWTSKNGSVYTLTQDVQLSDLTVASGVTLNTGNYIIYGTGTLTNSGTIQNNGAAGGDGGSMVGGTAGATTTGGTLATNTSGKVGGAGVNSVNGGNTGINGTNINPSLGDNGAAGGIGGANNGCGNFTIAGGVAGTATSETVSGSIWKYLTSTTTLSVGVNTIAKINRYEIRGSTSLLTLSSSAGSGSGGAGLSCGAGAGGSGGGSGATGGIIAIYFPTIVLNSSSVIQANGGNGGNGSNGEGTYSAGGGGGAGANGGLIFLIYKTLTNNGGTIQALAGIGGTYGSGTTGITSGMTAGADGTAGKIYKVVLTN